MNWNSKVLMSRTKIGAALTYVWSFTFPTVGLDMFNVVFFWNWIFWVIINYIVFKTFFGRNKWEKETWQNLKRKKWLQKVREVSHITMPSSYFNGPCFVLAAVSLPKLGVRKYRREMFFSTSAGLSLHTVCTECDGIDWVSQRFSLRILFWQCYLLN